ncbi:MAG: hypothetical protein AAGF24_06260 [Cyanobacteria bacterium P01_H01_bin.121]
MTSELHDLRSRCYELIEVLSTRTYNVKLLRLAVTALQRLADYKQGRTYQRHN